MNIRFYYFQRQKLFKWLFAFTTVSANMTRTNLTYSFFGTKKWIKVLKCFPWKRKYITEQLKVAT